jgi:gamma-glutamyl:cysteine ligase YbdK (ATP-grasp superfamily)
VAYYTARFGFDEMEQLLERVGLAEVPVNQAVLCAAKSGLDTRYTRSEGSIRCLLPSLVRMAGAGLRHRNIDPGPMEQELRRILQEGNDAEQLRKLERSEYLTPTQLKNQYIDTFCRSLHQVLCGESYV